MYHPVKVDRLSKNQVSKLLNHHGVRVKLNPHGPHTIHVSKEQHKKLERAHLKGSGAIITLDPYQAHNHQHLRGTGTKIMDQKFTGNDVAHFVGAHKSSEPLMDKPITLKQAEDAGKRAKKFFGLGAKKHSKKSSMSGGKVRKSKAIRDLEKFFRPIGSAMVHEVIPGVSSMLGGIAGAELGPVGSIAGASAGRVAGKQLADKIGAISGLGIKKRGRPKKVGVAHAGGALVAAGYGVKKRGRPKKKAV